MRRLPLLLGAVLIGAIIAFPIGVLAAHQFGDVPTEHLFHNDIAAIADAGVTTGCGGGNYCPEDYVTRGQMAAFMNRLGALAPGKVPVVNATELDGLDSTQLARADVVVGGTWNCAAHAMIPASDDYSYSIAGHVLWVDNAFAGAFHCPLFLPDGAKVLGLKVALRDDQNNGGVTCILERYPVLINTVEDEMARVQSGFVDIHGEVTLEDGTVDDSDVDNDAFSYDLRCVISGPGGVEAAFYGAMIEYQTSGIPVD